MILKHNDIVIPKGKNEDPFENCKLDRKPLAENLTAIIDSYADGFVLAINNEWGTGKTTFIKMWNQYLLNKDFKTLYFNAWENDFQNEALVAFLAELESLITKDSKSKSAFKKLAKTAAKLSKNILPLIISAAANKFIDTKVLQEAISEIAKNTDSIFQEELNDFQSKKKSLEDFRNQLKEYIKSLNSSKPLVFFIDELDRCRPNYAVEVLEKIKHFFSVPGIVFVLSVDKTQLSHAVRGVYGSDKINGEEYLRRFIDLEFNIPEPNTEQFCNYLYDYFDFESFMFSISRRRGNDARIDIESFKKFSSILFKGGNLNLRQQEKIFSLSRLALNQFRDNYHIFYTLFIFLSYLKIIDSDFFDRILDKKITVQEMIDRVEIIFSHAFSNDTKRYFLFVEALMLYFYNNYQKGDYGHNKLVFREEQAGEGKLSISPELSSDYKSDLMNIIQKIDRLYADVTIDYLMDKINLLEPIIMSDE